MILKVPNETFLRITRYLRKIQLEEEEEEEEEEKEKRKKKKMKKKEEKKKKGERESLYLGLKNACMCFDICAASFD